MGTQKPNEADIVDFILGRCRPAVESAVREALLNDRELRAVHDFWDQQLSGLSAAKASMAERSQADCRNMLRQLNYGRPVEDDARVAGGLGAAFTVPRLAFVGLASVLCVALSVWFVMLGDGQTDGTLRVGIYKTVYVDAAVAQAGQPAQWAYNTFQTIGEGVDAVEPGGMVLVRSGKYEGAYTFDKSVRIRAIEGPVRIGGSGASSVL